MLALNMVLFAHHKLGTGGDDVLTGKNGADTLSGLAGDDSLRGLGGADSISGDAGDDRLDGGAGDDRIEGGTVLNGQHVTIIGGLGADELDSNNNTVFVYRAVAESARERPDTIAFLDATETIDISAIDADPTKQADQAFVIVDKFDEHPGELKYKYLKGYTTVSADVDGDGVADLRIEVHGGDLRDSNFVL